MFHAASAAFVTMTFFVVSFDHFAIVPGRRPTRGSGLGGDGLISGAAIGPLEDDDDIVAHAAANTTPTPTVTEIKGENESFT